MFGSLGGFTYRHRWVTLVAWLLAFLVSVAFAPRAFEALRGTGFDLEGTESARALQSLGEMGRSQSTVEVVFHRDDAAFPDTGYLREIETVLEPVSRLPGIVGIDVPQDMASPFVSRDGHSVIALLWVDGGLDDTERLIPRIRAALAPPPGLTVHTTGTAAVLADIQEASERDFRRGEVLSAPLVLALLLLVFGTVVAAALPVAVGIIAVTVTLAFVYLIASQTAMSIFTANIATFLGLGAAIDYSLLMVGRFREELTRGSVEQAVRTTLHTAGRAIFYSALATGLGMAGLLMFNVTMMRSIGAGGILVVAISALTALTFTSAFLAILGPRINAIRVPFLRSEIALGFWRRLATGVMRRPILVTVTVSILLVLAGIPFLRVELGAATASILPQSYDSRQGWDLVGRQFGPGQVAPIIVVLRSEDSIYSLERLRELKEFTTKVAADKRVARVESIVDVAPGVRVEEYAFLYANPGLIPDPRIREMVSAFSNEKVTFVRVFSAYDPAAPESKDLVRYIREIQPNNPGLSAMTSGLTAGILDSVKLLYGRFPWAIALVVTTTYLALLVLFRSVVLPLKAVLMNGASIIASYGALVFIFQDGNLGWLLGVEAQGSIDATLPILLFFILFGLSMDYEVFLLARIKEAYELTGDNAAAVGEGLERTGRIITSAALVVILVSAGFATGGLVLVKAVAVGLALAIAVDVSIVRSLLVPALMRLLGNWNWWAPRFLRGSSATKSLEPGS